MKSYIEYVAEEFDNGGCLLVITIGAVPKLFIRRREKLKNIPSLVPFLQITLRDFLDSAFHKSKLKSVYLSDRIYK